MENSVSALLLVACVFIYNI